MLEPPYLSIVIPVYHEEQRLPRSLAILADFCGKLERSWEVLIVVERGSDRTLEIAGEFAARQAHFRVIDSGPQRGKGHAVRTGMLQAQGEFVFYMDVDLSVPLAFVPVFLREFAAHPEWQWLAGNRQHRGSRITRRQSWLRRTMGQVFNRILQACGAAPSRDTQCGFKAFRRRAAQAIFARQQLDGFAFDVEVLLLADRLGLTGADLPVEWRNSPESKVHIVRDSLRMLRDAVRVRRLVAAALEHSPEKATDSAERRENGA